MLVGQTPLELIPFESSFSHDPRWLRACWEGTVCMPRPVYCGVKIEAVYLWGAQLRTAYPGAHRDVARERVDRWLMGHLRGN